MSEPIVISASRRTDLVGCYPDVLWRLLEEFPPAEVHSIVLWTKNPNNLLIEGPLRRKIGEYRQIYIHLTITGMGGGEFEPMIPRWEEVVGMIGPLIELVGDPRRISWRFDPILEAEGQGRRYSNFHLFDSLARRIAPLGIEDCRVSWVSPYKRALNRLKKKGWRLISRTLQERSAQAAQLNQTASRHGLKLHFCAMDGFPISRCIDGELLNSLHPDGWLCCPSKAKGQRELCGCTHSRDIGWYSLRCRQGCLYCYACP